MNNSDLRFRKIFLGQIFSQINILGSLRIGGVVEWYDLQAVKRLSAYLMELELIEFNFSGARIFFL